MAMPGTREERVDEVDVRVVGQKSAVVGALRRKEAKEHQRRGARLLHGHAVVPYVRRELRLGQVLPYLGEDQVGVRVGLHVEVDVMRIVPLLALTEYM